MLRFAAAAAEVDGDWLRRVLLVSGTPPLTIVDVFVVVVAIFERMENSFKLTSPGSTRTLDDIAVNSGLLLIVLVVKTTIFTMNINFFLFGFLNATLRFGCVQCVYLIYNGNIIGAFFS